jgi:hypothetical protein
MNHRANSPKKERITTDIVYLWRGKEPQVWGKFFWERLVEARTATMNYVTRGLGINPKPLDTQITNVLEGYLTASV